ncbi:hypothetical protein B0J18DRAFT_104240 [Chaetomium sp. MPI-SDFR-AT-0129]|nr:hypothetical protein B0J18DRAFT_104240 [Chaetomium sp. MPI-SDFR-AT-0129]
MGAAAMHRCERALQSVPTRKTKVTSWRSRLSGPRSSGLGRSFGLAWPAMLIAHKSLSLADCWVGARGSHGRHNYIVPFPKPTLGLLLLPTQPLSLSLLFIIITVSFPAVCLGLPVLPVRVFRFIFLFCLRRSPDVGKLTSDLLVWSAPTRPSSVTKTSTDCFCPANLISRPSPQLIPICCFLVLFLSSLSTSGSSHYRAYRPISPIPASPAAPPRCGPPTG